MSLDWLGDQCARYLASAQVGILVAAGSVAIPVCYRSHHLSVECLVPRWSEAVYVLEEQSLMTLLVTQSNNATCWLQYHGVAQIVATTPCQALWDSHHRQPDLAMGYTIIMLSPRRLDLFDQQRGWGFRETLEF